MPLQTQLLDIGFTAGINSNGVYAIRNRVSGRCYIGAATKRGFSWRWRQHLIDLRGGYHGNTHLQAAWDKYGAAAFSFEVLEIRDDALVAEQAWLDAWFPTGLLYNQARIAGAPMAGRKHSAETRAKFSERLRGNSYAKGFKHTAETIAKSHRGGWSHSPESKEKIAAGNRGKVVSPEARARIAEARRWKGGDRYCRRGHLQRNKKKPGGDFLSCLACRKIRREAAKCRSKLS